MLVSVIVLTYRNIGYLEENIRSIFKQNYDEIEIIIQDDGTDGFNVEQIRRQFEPLPSNIVNFIVSTNERNLGTVKNYNRAIALANGEIIIPLSCDDMFYSDSTISEIVDFFNKTQCNVCTAYRKGLQSASIYPAERDVAILKESDTEILLHRLYVSNFISGASLYWRKDFLENLGCFDERYLLLEDYPMILRLVESGKRIDFLDKITILYNESGVSNRKDAILNKNSKISNDAKLVKDMYVIPNLNKVKSMRIQRLILACYYLKFSTEKKDLLISLVKYLDIWILVGMAYVFYVKIKKKPFDVYNIIKE